MHNERFSGILLEGHKDGAVEFPYDPTRRWGLPAVRLEPGRHGHRVQGKLNGVEFQSVIVPRAGRFWVAVSDEVRVAAGVIVGERVEITLRPAGSVASPEGPPRRARTRKPGTKSTG